MAQQIRSVRNELELASVLADLSENIEAATENLAESPRLIDQHEAASDLLMCIPYLVRAVELLAEQSKS